MYPKEGIIYDSRYLNFIVKLSAKITKIHNIEVYYGTYSIGEVYMTKRASERTAIKQEIKKAKKAGNLGLAGALELQANNKKLEMNAIYGKTIENVEGRKKTVLSTNQKWINKALSDIRYADSYELSDDLVLISKQEHNCCLNKPIFIGKAILDIAKLDLLKFLYNDVFPTYGFENIELMCTDTDSVHLLIKNHTKHDVYDKIADFKTTIDMSGAPSGQMSLSRYNPSIGRYKCNKDHAGELGSFKEENGGVICTEMHARRAKCYYKSFANGDEKGTYKGIDRTAKNDNARGLVKGDVHEIQVMSIRKGFRTSEDHCKTYTTITNKKVTQKEENKVKRFPNGYYVPWGCCESVYKMVESKPPLFV